MFRLLYSPHGRRRAVSLSQRLEAAGLPLDPAGPDQLLLLTPETPYQWLGGALADVYRRHRFRPGRALCLVADRGPVLPPWAAPCPTLPLSTGALSVAQIAQALPAPGPWPCRPFQGLVQPSWAHAPWVYDDPLVIHPDPRRWPDVGSSLVLAGPPASARGTWLYSLCLPRLAFSPPDGGAPWRLAICPPGEPPAEALAGALGRALRRPVSLDEPVSLDGRLMVVIEDLHLWLRRPAQALTALSWLADRLSEGAPIALVATLDDRAASKLGDLPPLGSWLEAGLYHRGAPDPDRLAAGLRHRAAAAGLRWQPGAVGAIVDRALATAAPLAEAAWLAHQAQRRLGLGDEPAALPTPSGPPLRGAIQGWLSARPRETAEACLALWRSQGYSAQDLRGAQVALADDALQPMGGGRSVPGAPGAPLIRFHPAWRQIWTALDQPSPTTPPTGEAAAPGEDLLHLRQLAQMAHSELQQLKRQLPLQAPALRVALDSLLSLREALGDDAEGAQLARDFEDRWGRMMAAVDAGELAQAFTCAERAAQIARRLCSLKPADDGAARSLGRALIQRGDLALEIGDFGQALADTEEALAVRRRLVEGQPQAVIYRRDLTVALERLSDLRLLQGDLPAARRALLEVRAIRGALADDHPQDHRLLLDEIVALSRLGELDARAGEWAQCLSVYREACALARRLVTGHPLSEQYAQLLWRLEHRLSTLALGAGDHDIPMMSMPSALHLAERWAHRSWGAVAAARSLALMAEAALAAGSPDESRVYVEELFTLLRDLAPARALTPWWAIALRLAAAFSLVDERLGEAMAQLSQSWTLWTALLDAGDLPPELEAPRRRWVEIGAALADVALRCGQRGVGRRICDRLMAWRRLGDGDPLTLIYAEAVAWSRRADLAAAKGRWDHAALMERRALTLWRGACDTSEGDARLIHARDEAEGRLSIWRDLAAHTGAGNEAEDQESESGGGEG